jgi:hypothetical protein
MHLEEKLRQAGYHELAASVAEQRSMPFVAKTRSTAGVVKMTGQAHPHMPTGGAGTHFWGGKFHKWVWIYAIGERIPFTLACAHLGLKVKEQWHDRLEDATFLRGWFHRAAPPAHGWAFAALPSVILKAAGKLLKDPVAMARDPKGAEMFFSAIMAGIPLSLDYPIVGAFRALATRCAGASERVQRLVNDAYIAEGHRYKVYGGTQVSRESVLNSMFIRYGITPEEVEDAEALIGSVKRIPAFVVHPVFSKMAEVDYPEDFGGPY